MKNKKSNFYLSIAGMCLAISPFFIFGKLKKNPAWKNYAKYTLVTGIIANIPGIILWIMVFTSTVPESIGGLIQRLGIVFIFIWIGVMSLKMLKLNMKKKNI
jgi:hypothetical protein